MNIKPQEEPVVAQLIDANLDRAREGLRVVEEWCRFSLTNKNLVITLKDWRQQLGRHHHKIYKQARNTSSDQGLGLAHPAQRDRHTPEHIVLANCARVQEALRVLEEFARKNNPELAKCAANIRYNLYDLEVKIIKGNNTFKRKKRLAECKICLITSPQKNLIKKVTEALESGINMVQYRDKISTDLEKFNIATKLANLCKKNDSLFIINDRIDLVIAVKADGVHLGQDDIPTYKARSILGTEYLIGRSTHSIEQLKNAEDEGCDYIGVGPIYETKTKPNSKSLGSNFILEASKLTKIPWFAIGGINTLNIKEVLNSGASRIAVISAIMNSENPTQSTSELLKEFK